MRVKLLNTVKLRKNECPVCHTLLPLITFISCIPATRFWPITSAVLGGPLPVACWCEQWFITLTAMTVFVLFVIYGLQINLTMIKERVQDFTVNLSPVVPCWMPSSRGREAERLRWQLGGEETPCCFVSEVRWLPQQKFYICRNLSATAPPNGILSNPGGFSLFLYYPSVIF